MKHLAPACFRTFTCAGGSCVDSCCRAGWEIIPDEETLARYRTLPGPAGARVRAGLIPGKEPLLRQDERRVCVLLDADGLCYVQRSFGHEALCRVCREYPRFHREFGNLTEHGISLSCPTAYALAVSTAPAWSEWEDDSPIVPNELDPVQYLRLRKGRELALSLLGREDLPLLRRLALTARLAHCMQAAPERLLSHDYALRLRRWSTLRADKGAGSSGSAPRAPSRGGLLSPGSTERAALIRLAERFSGLEILSPAWSKALKHFQAALDREPVRDCFETRTPEIYARYLAYSLYKYWLDALDDGDLEGRAARSICMTLLGLAMDNALPGAGPFLQRISREIEHCEENLEALRLFGPCFNRSTVFVRQRRPFRSPPVISNEVRNPSSFARKARILCPPSK